MPIEFKNANGTIKIENEVIANVAGITAMESYGIVGMAAKSVKDGFFKLLKKESLTKGIKIVEVNNKINIELHIVVLYGTNIKAIGDTIIDSVRYNVTELTGVYVDKVEVFIVDIRSDNEKNN